MSLSTQPYKGTRDFYPEDKRKQKYMFGVIRRVVEGFGYIEYDGPTLEPLELYTAKTSEEIVNNQTYSFTDRGDRKVVMRPEMTPTVSRMVAGRRQELAYPLRLYSIDNFFRYERTQRGRLREFWQLNADLFGIEGFEGDFEIIQLADSIMKAFGARPEMYEIRISSRKLLEKRIEAAGPKDELSTIIRLVDSRDKMPESEFEEKLAKSVERPSDLLNFFSNDGPTEENRQIIETLKSVGIDNVVDSPNLARGFDYYTGFIFEVYDKNPDNNRSMFGGGRYDGLIAEFGVEPLPTVGFALGDVTLQNFLESNSLMPTLSTETDAAVILVGDVFEGVQSLLTQLRSEGVNLAVDASNRKIDAKIKSAVKTGVKFAIFIGEQELSSGKYRLKNLETGEEQEAAAAEIAKRLG